MIDKKNSQVWFEIFNPNNESIPVINIMISGFRSANILSPEIRGKLVIKPKEKLIICGNNESYKSAYGSAKNLIELEELINLGNEGFIAVNNSRESEDAYNIIWFGKNSTKVPEAKDKNVLEFTDSGLYYSRSVNSNDEVSEWSKINFNPNN